MTEHYYSRKPSTASDEQKIEAVLLGMKLTYITDQGVFSKTGIDFGSRLLIESFQSQLQNEVESSTANPYRVLDLGCGYGAMGLALAKKFPQIEVTMADINERAVGLAKKNAVQLSIKNAVILQSDGFGSLGNRKFEQIITNPPIRAGKQLIHGWFEQSVNYLEPGGSLWIVIQKKQGAPSALKKLEEVYGVVEEVERDKGYSIFRATKK